MAEMSIRVITEPFKAAVDDRKKRVDRASMYAVRATARAAKQNARRAAPVYRGDNAVRVSTVKKARKAGVNLRGEKLGKGEMVEGAGQVVAGLLRDSISSSRRLRKIGGSYAVTVGPRGPRVHLYAAKIEDQAHFMARGYAAAIQHAPAIHAKAWANAMK